MAFCPHSLQAQGLRLSIPEGQRPGKENQDCSTFLLKSRVFDLEYIQRWLLEFDRRLAEKLRERFDEVRQSRPKG